MKKPQKKIKASEFDQAFEDGRATEHLDMSTAKVRYPVQRINIDIPQEILAKVDREADRVGVPRTSLLKLWIAERVDQMIDLHAARDRVAEPSRPYEAVLKDLKDMKKEKKLPGS